MKNFQRLVVFRKYELSLVASDEHDIVYTRSNIRHEQSLFLFPVRLGQAESKALFCRVFT